jgi:hypothetical protein
MVGRTLGVTVSDIRKAVASVRSANQPFYVLCTEYSSFPWIVQFTILKQSQDPSGARCHDTQDPSGARCQDPIPSNSNCG